MLSAFLPPPEPTAPLAFGGAPAGDVYSLPSVLVSATLTEAGFFANNIGPNTPWSVLSLTIDHYHPRLVWISSSAAIAPEEESAFLTGLENLAAKCLSTGTQLVIGGRGLPAAVRTQSIPGLFRLDTLRQLAALARTLTTEPEGAKLDAVLTG